MKKTISFLSLLFGLFVCVTLFSACNKDDDKGSSSSTNPIVGTWCVDKNDKHTEMTFEKDMTFTWMVYDITGTNLKDSDSGTYNIVEDLLYTTWKKHSANPRKFRVEGNHLITDEAGGTTWTRK